MFQAAREVGVSTSTMRRYIKKGRISAARIDGGGYEIDASELTRVFPGAWPRKSPATPDTLPGAGTDTGAETAGLRTEIKMLREMLERADLTLDRERRAASDTIDDLRARLDREGEERRTLNARLLTYQAPPPVASATPAAGASGSPAPSADPG